MPEKEEVTPKQEVTTEIPKSGLLLASEELKQVRERYAETVSNGGGTGVSDTNDNQSQIV